jgi:hypothetical protein
MGKTKRKVSPERQLDRQLGRHAVKFQVCCDLMDPTTGRAWPVTISSVPGEFFIGLLFVTPHSKGGRKFCAALKRGDVVRYWLGVNFFCARVATKNAFKIWLHAVDVSMHAIVPAWVPDPDDPRHADTVKKWNLRNG